jgi:hypothetical protein
MRISIVVTKVLWSLLCTCMGALVVIKITNNFPVFSQFLLPIFFVMPILVLYYGVLIIERLFEK